MYCSASTIFFSLTVFNVCLKSHAGPPFILKLTLAFPVRMKSDRNKVSHFIFLAIDDYISIMELRTYLA